MAIDEPTSSAEALQVTIEPPEIPADGSSRALLTVRADGAPFKSDNAVTIRINRGRLSSTGASQELTEFKGTLGATGEIVLDLIAGQDIGDGVVGVTVGPYVASASYTFTPSRPTVAPVLQFNKTTLKAGGADNLTATIRLLRPADGGKVSANIPIEISSTGQDSLTFPTTVVVDATGEAKATVVSTAVVGSAMLTFTTELEDGSLAESTQWILTAP